MHTHNSPIYFRVILFPGDKRLRHLAASKRSEHITQERRHPTSSDGHVFESEKGYYHRGYFSYSRARCILVPGMDDVRISQLLHDYYACFSLCRYY